MVCFVEENVFFLGVVFPIVRENTNFEFLFLSRLLLLGVSEPEAVGKAFTFLAD